jgi:hypothetical protein
MRHGRWKSVQIARRYIRQGARGTTTPRLTSDCSRCGGATARPLLDVIGLGLSIMQFDRM